MIYCYKDKRIGRPFENHFPSIKYIQNWQYNKISFGTSYARDMHQLSVFVYLHIDNHVTRNLVFNTFPIKFTRWYCQIHTYKHTYYKYNIALCPWYVRLGLKNYATAFDAFYFIYLFLHRICETGEGES